jgi:hypothetical protein
MLAFLRPERAMCKGGEFMADKSHSRSALMAERVKLCVRADLFILLCAVILPVLGVTGLSQHQAVSSAGANFNALAKKKNACAVDLISKFVYKMILCAFEEF